MATCNTSELIAAGRCFSCLTPGQMEMVRLQLLCEILYAVGGSPAPPACECVTPTLTDLHQASSGVPFIVSLSWTLPGQFCENGTIQIFRSVNGGAFSLWENASADVTTHQNNGNNPPGSNGQTITIKIRFASDELGVDCDFSNELSVQLISE